MNNMGTEEAGVVACRGSIRRLFHRLRITESEITSALPEVFYQEPETGDVQFLEIQTGAEDKVVSHSLLETWLNFSSFVGTIPYSFQRKDESSDTTMNYPLISKAMWIIGCTLTVIDIISRVPDLLRAFDGEPDPFVYIQIGSIVINFLLQVLFVRMTVAKSKYLIFANNFLVKSPYSRTKVSHLKFRLVTLFCATYTALQIFLNAVFTVKLELAVAGHHHAIGVTNLIQNAACRGKETLMMTRCNAELNGSISMSSMSASEMAWGVVGFTFQVHQGFLESTISLGILFCCISLFLAVNQAHLQVSLQDVHVYNSNITNNLASHYALLKDVANELSHYIGEVLLVYLIDISFRTPSMIETMFSGSRLIIANVLMKQAPGLLAMLFAALAALRIDQLQEKLTNPDQVNQWPTDQRLIVAFFHGLFRKSIGIGLPGIYVANFKFLISYFTMQGTLIMVVYDVLRNRE